MRGSVLRRMVVRIFLPLRWKNDPGAASIALKRFGDVEADSGWQYMRAIGMTDDPALKKMLFENVLEEFRHADYFYEAAHSLSQRRLRSVGEERTCLINSRDEMSRFLAYVHVNEKAIHDQFASYADACTYSAVKDVFRRISVEEEGHQAEAHHFLEVAAGSERRARAEIGKARLRRAYESWMRASRSIGGVPLGAVLATTFFLFGPLMRSRKSETELQPRGTRPESAKLSAAALAAPTPAAPFDAARANRARARQRDKELSS